MIWLIIYLTGLIVTLIIEIREGGYGILLSPFWPITIGFMILWCIYLLFTDRDYLFRNVLKIKKRKL